MDVSDEDYVPLWVFISVNVTLILVTVAGNLMVILANARDSGIRQTVANTLILNLSVTDLLVGIFIFAPNTLWRIYDAWVFGTVSRKVWLVIDYSLFSVSTFTVVFISLDRYWLVIKGLAYSSFQTPQMVLVELVTVWVITVLYYACIAFVAPLGASHESDFAEEDCELEVVQSTWFNVFEIVVLFLTPFSALVFLNGMIYHNILKRSKGLVATKRNLFGDSPERMLDDTVAEEGNPMRMIISKRKKLRSNENQPNSHVDVARVGSIAVSFAVHSTTYVFGTGELEEEGASLADRYTTTCHTEGKNGFASSSLDTARRTHVDKENETAMMDNSSTQRAGRSDAAPLDGTTAKRSDPFPNSANSFGRRKEQYRRDRNELKRHRKAAITLGAIVFVYCVCCLPYFIYAIVVSLCKECVSYRVWEMVSYLQWSKSAINPFIYGFTNLLFRRNFAKFLLVYK